MKLRRRRWFRRLRDRILGPQDFSPSYLVGVMKNNPDSHGSMQVRRVIKLFEEEFGYAPIITEIL